MNRPGAVVLTVAVEIAGQPTRAGTAFISQRRGVVSTVFTYDAAYQRNPGAYSIRPELPLATATHHLHRLPGTLADSAPDR